MDISSAINEAVDSVLTLPELQATEEEAQEEAQVDFDVEAQDEDVEVEASDEEESDDETEEEEAPKSNLPEGYVDVPSIEEGLATEFALLDEEGEVEIPALKVRYKANGQMREDRLDQVVKLAQWGVYNSAKDSEFKQTQEEYLAAKSEAQEYSRILEEREQQIRKLLEDDDYFYRVRERYEAENSPEMRARRAEEELRSYRTQQEMKYIEDRGSQFFQSEVEPAIKMIADALPTVTQDELAQRMVSAIQAHARQAPNGNMYIPEESYDAVRNYIVEDLAFWAQMQHSRRGGSATNSEMEKAQKDLERARVEAQKAKRAVGKKTRPVGKAQAEKNGKKSKPINTVDDALSSAMDSILSSIS